MAAAMTQKVPITGEVARKEEGTKSIAFFRWSGSLPQTAIVRQTSKGSKSGLLLVVGKMLK